MNQWVQKHSFLVGIVITTAAYGYAFSCLTLGSYTFPHVSLRDGILMFLLYWVNVTIFWFFLGPFDAWLGRVFKTSREGEKYEK